MFPTYGTQAATIWDDSGVKNPTEHPAETSKVRADEFGTRYGAQLGPQPGLADPAWTRLLVASLVPLLLALSSLLPSWGRAVLIVLLMPLLAQGWQALVRSRHDNGSAAVIALAGIAAVLAVTFTNNLAYAAVVMGLSIIGLFVAQMLRKDGRPDLVEDLSSATTGTLVAISGAGWCAMSEGIATPTVIVPTSLALFVGALLTVVEMPARILELLTATIPALVAGIAGGVLALSGFFGPAHSGNLAALQSASASLLVGFVAGVMMLAGNRILWTHKWVPGGRAAISSALAPLLGVGLPMYAIARLMGPFIFG